MLSGRSEQRGISPEKRFMITSEAAVLDTNVLVYPADEMSPFHVPSRDLRDRGVRGDEKLCIFPQVMSEFYAILTDPKRVSNPRSQEEVVAEIEKYLQAKRILKLFTKSQCACNHVGTAQAL